MKKRRRRNKVYLTGPTSSTDLVESAPCLHLTRPTSSTRVVESGDRASHLLTTDSTTQLEPQLESSSRTAYTRESMEDSISSFFSKP